MFFDKKELEHNGSKW